MRNIYALKFYYCGTYLEGFFNELLEFVCITLVEFFDIIEEFIFRNKYGPQISEL